MSSIITFERVTPEVDLPEVPLCTGPQAQGDVVIVPIVIRNSDIDVLREETLSVEKIPSGEPFSIPPKGIPVVTGETAGGNSHILQDVNGGATWLPAPDAATSLTQGYLTVPEDGEVVLIHSATHGMLRIGNGCYEVRRQREFAGEWRRVTD